MSKSTELVDPRILREQAFALEAWQARLSFEQIRRRALLPEERGGLGKAISESGIKALVMSALAAKGDLSMGREEKRIRQSAETDVRTRLAAFDLERAHATLLADPPDRAEYADREEYRDAVAMYWKGIEAATKLVESADRRLDSAHNREAKLFGLDEATRIEAEVTTRDGAIDDLNAALVALGADPVEVTS